MNCCTPINKHDFRDVANFSFGTAVGITFLVLGILALQGQLNISHGGAIALIVLGSINLSHTFIRSIITTIAHCKENHYVSV